LRLAVRRATHRYVHIALTIWAVNPSADIDLSAWVKRPANRTDNVLVVVARIGHRLSLT